MPGPYVHGDSPGKNTGVGCHALLQGILPMFQEIFLTQESNRGLLHCRQLLHQLSYLGQSQFIPVVFMSVLLSSHFTLKSVAV